MRKFLIFITGFLCASILIWLAFSRSPIKFEGDEIIIKEIVERRELVFLRINGGLDSASKLNVMKENLVSLGFNEGSLRSEAFEVFIKQELDNGGRSFSKSEQSKNGEVIVDAVLYESSSEDIYLQMCFEGKFPAKIVSEQIGFTKSQVIKLIAKKMNSLGCDVTNQNTGEIIYGE